MLSCIYASYNAEIRKYLWNSLLQPGYNIPWMAIGDYNIVRSQDEKVGGLPVDANAISSFNDMINQVGFLDGGFTGSQCTWSNNRLGRHKILQRLERELINTPWSSNFLTSISHLHRNCSDHALLLVIVSQPNILSSAFRYLNVWERHHDFLQMVEDCWAHLRMVDLW